MALAISAATLGFSAMIRAFDIITCVGAGKPLARGLSQQPL
jgi:hypothetical protein